MLKPAIWKAPLKKKKKKKKKKRKKKTLRACATSLSLKGGGVMGDVQYDE